METNELPPLAEFLRWLGEAPAAFQAVPLGFAGGRTPVHAVVADLWDTLFGQAPDDALLQAVRPANDGKGERNRLLWVLAACRLLWHPALRSRPLSADGVRRLLARDLVVLAAATPVEQLREEEERREELVRRALAALDLRLPGESARDAEDRLAQVDSVERRRLLREAADKERRAREIRERMAARAAQEAATRYSPE